MKPEPLISIGMPVYNCEQTLAESIRSILLQTYHNWELLLIDDGSTDGTLQVARQFQDPRIQLHACAENRGLPVRLNQAVQMSQGVYFTRMDGDDIAYPQKFEQQMNYLVSHPEVDLVGAGAIVFGCDGVALGKLDSPERHDQICARAFRAVFPIAHTNFFGPLSWFQQHPYDETAIKAQDQVLLLRTYRTSTFANVPGILLGVRRERLDLNKMLKTRSTLMWVFFREALRLGRFDLAVLSAAIHIIKAVVEIVAVTTGLNYRLLPHRARPITREEQHQWEQVWRMVNQEEQVQR